MDNLTNMIEAILFASGKSVAFADISDKLNVTTQEIEEALDELRLRYGEDGGIRLLEFNHKAQLASNPAYKDQVSAVLNPIRERELTRTVLETVAIIAYKQPITRTEIEMCRGSNSNYAVDALLTLKLIEPCGRKDAVGRPILFATTDEFLKRFKLKSLSDLPDYEELMAAIARESSEERDNYLYARDDIRPEEEKAQDPARASSSASQKHEEDVTEDGYAIPDFLRGLDGSDIVKIS